MAADTRVVPWRIEAGEREVLAFPIQDEDGDLILIDDWTVDAKIRTRPGGPILYTWPPELAVINADGNTVELTIPAPVSALWTWTSGWYRCRITNPDTDPADPATYRVLEGPLVVDPD